MALNRDTRQFAPLVSGMTDKKEIEAAIANKQAEINAQVEAHNLNHARHRQRHMDVISRELREYEAAHEGEDAV